jgi:hypothetical protein
MESLLLDKCKNEACLQQLKVKGYHIFDELYPKYFCDAAIEFIDNNKKETHEYNYSDTEVRIWGAQDKSPLLKSFCDDSVKAYNYIFSRNSKAKTLLAINNDSVRPEDEESRLGRWHVDSFFSQWKVFLFLKDTDNLSGPFEFMPQTASWLFKINNITKYIKISDFLKNKRAYSCFSDSWLKKVRSSYSPIPVICKAGTVIIVRTDAIHRARPCYSGSRYALTTYLE